MKEKTKLIVCRQCGAKVQAQAGREKIFCGPLCCARWHNSANREIIAAFKEAKKNGK